MLLHGNTVTLDDWIVSGVFDLIARSRRVVAFDRPGFGYSERPRDRSWTPGAQARLLRRACRRLGVERPVVVGHSWGRWWHSRALQAPQEVAGLVLASGYYYPSRRLDVALVDAGRRAAAGRRAESHRLTTAHADDAAGHIAQNVCAAPCAGSFQ